ncbi:hypothetical protein NPIL_511641 [Nephila pilipes]|uniref:Uncharacterized protein n=1 Tax=Nephila pilipes TaxID=299642 RepID=A0A8X6QP96_NEPPI|nr:hypothetical protein NPIL_511641 [Nephila pilipes]
MNGQLYGNALTFMNGQARRIALRKEQACGYVLMNGEVFGNVLTLMIDQALRDVFRNRQACGIVLEEESANGIILMNGHACVKIILSLSNK